MGMQDAGVTPQELAEALRPRIDEIGAWVEDRFFQLYDSPLASSLDSGDSLRWARGEIEEFVECVGRGGVSSGVFSSWVMGLEGYWHPLTSPLIARLEMLQLYAEGCVHSLWDVHSSDRFRLNEAIDCLESCVERLIEQDTERFLRSHLVPGALRREWNVCPAPHGGQARGTEGVQAGQRVQQSTVRPADTASACAKGDEFPVLTERQAQIVALVAQGKSNGEIAGELGLSQNTVRNYIAQLFEVYGVGSRTELAVRSAAGMSLSKD